jgi:multimeric flavodoxin WrbA
MQSLYPKLREADILMLATPVYVPFPREMQNLVNRLVPLLERALGYSARPAVPKEISSPALP